MEKVIIFINKEILVQQYTLFMIDDTYITSYWNSYTKNDHILLYMYNDKFLSSPYDQNKPLRLNKLEQ